MIKKKNKTIKNEDEKETITIIKKSKKEKKNIEVEKETTAIIKKSEEEKKNIAVDVKVKKEKTKKRKREIESEKKKNNEDLIEKLAIPACGFNWDNKDDEIKKEDSSSSEDEDADKEPSKKKKKLSAAERREQERIKEREIRQREEALASNELPNSVDQFDRLVLASPNNSLVWLKYMAYHLQATEIEKARSIARRALKTINFREEDEKLNIWQGLLNLESKFGTSETLENVLKDAIRSNDAKKIYLHMLTIYSNNKCITELEKIVKTLTAKFRTDPQVWIDCGCAFLKSGSKDKSRHTMQRALQSLPDNKHVDIIIQFAILENKYGDKERFKTLFEQILTSYPKRIDVWTSFVDLLIKDNDIDAARSVLERAVVQNLQPRKMKTLFQKFISFEEKYGTKDNIQNARKLAQEYVTKKCNNTNTD
ncbi:hypothetical protein HCN44_004153 [Aphidius gifuensis]|uniref:Suppressor of forked domain-containing protein n=2 Tax=Aphidius gifuensis TaxID=684658 RepID=A0A834Y157_APHGI|nr:hypothetical protein HCN44_004153 [Aphidius gifuensis]